MNPETVINGAVSIVRTQFGQGLDLRIEIAPDFPDWIEADPTRVRQILLNLLSNALKFTDQGQITVGVRDERSSANRSAFRGRGYGHRDSRRSPAPAVSRLFPARQFDHAALRRDGAGALNLQATGESNGRRGRRQQRPRRRQRGLVHDRTPGLSAAGPLGG